MHPFGAARPDPRLVRRLAQQLRLGGGAEAFAAAGEALAVAVLSTRGREPMPGWAWELAETMVGRLMLTVEETVDEATPAMRVRLCVAAAALAAVRPFVARRCDEAIGRWTRWGLGPAERMEDPHGLFGRTLLALYLDDADEAAESVTALLSLDPDGPGLILHDWTVARVQVHGLDRESLCFHNLRVHLARSGPSSAGFVLLAALVLFRRGGLKPARVLDWLDEVAREVRRTGTTRLAAGA